MNTVETPSSEVTRAPLRIVDKSEGVPSWTPMASSMLECQYLHLRVLLHRFFTRTKRNRIRMLPPSSIEVDIDIAVREVNEGIETVTDAEKKSG